MIQDKTIDEALVELARTMKALRALRAARKAAKDAGTFGCWFDGTPRHSASAKRASLDLTRKLADLRAGR